MAKKFDESAEAKLPQWAQERIIGLRNQIAHLNKILAENSGVTGPTDTVLVRYGVDPDFKLPNGSVIRFTLNANDDYIDVYVKNGVLEIMGGGGALTITPRVSNVIQVSQIAGYPR
jgi:hypothetical protein